MYRILHEYAQYFIAPKVFLISGASLSLKGTTSPGNKDVPGATKELVVLITNTTKELRMYFD